MWQQGEDWFAYVRALGVSAVAEELGLSSPRPRTLAPCPSCGEERRGSDDRRGPIGIRRDDLGWECHRCKAKGDALTLAAWLVCGTAKPPGEGWREIKSRFFGAEPLRVSPRARPKSQPTEPPRPPLGELAELWEACGPVLDDPELSAQLEARAIDPELVTERDLARALPTRNALPRWAFGPSGPWNRSGHRLITPLFDAQGCLQSLHARNPAGDAKRPKGLSPARCSVSGLVFAEGLARLFLEKGAAPPWWGSGQEDRFLIIAEGVPDFLTWATRYPGEGEAYLSSPAVLGILAGSWSPELAARVPREIRVMVRTHPDLAGEKYANQICSSLAARGLRVFRRRKEDT